MNTDLYTILGITRKATHADIKHAYRLKASNSHPDKGGNEEEFKQVSLAYTVLSNEEKKAKYDATGQYTNKPDNKEAELAYMVFSTVQRVVQKALSEDRLETSNIIGDAIALVREAITRLDQEILTAKDARKNIHKVIVRIKHSGINDFITNGFLSQIALIDSNINAHYEQIDKWLDAIVVLKEYTYSQDSTANWLNAKGGSFEELINSRYYL